MLHCHNWQRSVSCGLLAFKHLDAGFWFWLAGAGTEGQDLDGTIEEEQFSSIYLSVFLVHTFFVVVLRLRLCSIEYA